MVESVMLTDREMKQYDYTLFRQLKARLYPPFDRVQNKPMVVKSYRKVVELPQPAVA